MATEQNAELQQELERTLKMRGFRYGLQEFVAAVGGVEALREHNERVSYDKPTLLDRKTKELIRVAVQSTGLYPLQIIQCHMLGRCALRVSSGTFGGKACLHTLVVVMLIKNQSPNHWVKLYKQGKHAMKEENFSKLSQKGSFLR